MPCQREQKGRRRSDLPAIERKGVVREGTQKQGGMAHAAVASVSGSAKRTESKTMRARHMSSSRATSPS